MKKILLAEGNPFLISIYTEQLRKSGYSVSIVSSGELAISRARKINPDLLILDAGLPGGPKDSSGYSDGFSVLRELKEDLGFKDMKIVLLSNFEKEEEILNFTDFGALKYFKKAENTSEEIVEEIKKILS